MRGFLRSRGLEVQWRRIEDSMKRVRPEGVLMRCLQLTVLERRIYKVRSPLSLWHIDGNHKLIRLSFSCLCFHYRTAVYNFFGLSFSAKLTNGCTCHCKPILFRYINMYSMHFFLIVGGVSSYMVALMDIRGKSPF